MTVTALAILSRRSLMSLMMRVAKPWRRDVGLAVRVVLPTTGWGRAQNNTILHTASGASHLIEVFGSD